jgi:lipoprotein signal peptidase
MDSRLTSTLIALVPAGAFFLDRATKAAARGFTVTSGTRMETGIIDTVVHENHGIIANLPVPIPAIIILTAVVIAVIAIVWWRSIRDLHGRPASSPVSDGCESGVSSDKTAAALMRSLALGLILGGALSNLYDRTTAGYVYDWILLFGRSAVNFADAFIVAGGVLFLAAFEGKRGD